ncbi:MAG TPA: HAD family hydrolase [Symbiobacteriaceae bacterium]|jgi:phosphoglycolate phosphatase-like HAD superfamily hydrolase
MKTTALLLFDVDGTLVWTKAGRRAFNRAFERVFGLENAAGTVPMAGRTDPLIYEEICRQCGLDPGTFGAWKLEFLGELAECLNAEPGVTLPGVVELMEAVAREPGWMVALGTGNVEEGARLKLGAHDLNRFFATGGFGGDGATRAEVIAAGIRKAEAIHGRPFDRVLVIGDTPLDIQCGKANRCLTVGVATGYHGVEELVAAGADLVMPNFADTAGVVSQFRTICLHDPLPDET